ncbi:hypothetical protein, partial [Bacillus cereus]
VEFAHENKGDIFVSI